MSMPLIGSFAVSRAAKCEVFFLRKHISRFVCASAVNLFLLIEILKFMQKFLAL